MTMLVIKDVLRRCVEVLLDSALAVHNSSRALGLSLCAAALILALVINICIKLITLITAVKVTDELYFSIFILLTITIVFDNKEINHYKNIINDMKRVSIFNRYLYSFTTLLFSLILIFSTL